MPKEILLVIIFLPLIVLGKVLWELVWWLIAINRLKEFAEKPFVCPNCGERFYIKWTKLFWYRDNSLDLIGKAKLKCPKCGEWDMCKRMDEAE